MELFMAPDYARWFCVRLIPGKLLRKKSERWIMGGTTCPKA
jgi:hypothetical protein